MNRPSPGEVIKRFRKNGGNVVFRYLRRDDLHDALEHINLLVKERAFIGNQTIQTLEDEMKWISSSLKDMREGKGVTIVVEINGRFAGFGSAKKKPHDANRHVCIIGIAISKDFRGRGIGKELLETLAQQASDVLRCRLAELSYQEHNTIARRVYERCGFKEVGRIPSGLSLIHI
mgnify:CR=1 FL=1